MPKKRIFWLVLFVAALALSLFTLAFARKLRVPRATREKLIKSQNIQAVAIPANGFYVRRALLHPQLVPNLIALGDRLEKPGKERITLTGASTRLGESVPVPVVLILQLPDKVRLTKQTGLQIRTVTFDGQHACAADRSEEDLIETLAYDSVDHFFFSEMNGEATRFLGPHFRLGSDANGQSATPVYDIFEVTEPIRVGQVAREQTKSYYFNSATHLLDRVRYELNRDALTIKVEVLFKDWRLIQGQQLPATIVRLENNTPVATLTFISSMVSSAVEDGSFNPPQCH